MAPLNLSKNINTNIFLNFCIRVLNKLISTLLSVKVWGLIGFTIVNTYLLLNGYLQSSDFATIQVTLITVIYGMREIFKVRDISETPIVHKLINKAKEKINDMVESDQPEDVEIDEEA